MSIFMLLGFATLFFLVLLLLGKTLTVIELRSLERDYRQNQARIAELEEDLDTSRRKYLIALKAEGVAKQKTSQLKTRLTSLRQQLEQIELTMAQQAARKEQEKEQKLEGLVMHLLGGPSVRRDSQFKRVMKVINQLVDLEKQGNSEDLFEAIRRKIKEMGREGLLQAAEQGGIARPAEMPAPETPEAGATEAQEPEEPQAAEVVSGAEEKVEAKVEAPQEPAAEKRSESQARRDRVRDAVVRKGR